MSGSPASSEWLWPPQTLQCWVLGSCAVALLGCVKLTVLAGSYQAAEFCSGSALLAAA